MTKSQNNLQPTSKEIQNIKSCHFSTTRGLDQQRYRVLDMDAKGDLYLYKSALLCKDEIIKRLINGTYHLADGNTSSVGNSIGKSITRASLLSIKFLSTITITNL